MTQKNNIDSNQLMTEVYPRFNISTLMTLQVGLCAVPFDFVDFFGLSNKVCFGMIVFRRVESIQLMTQLTFQVINSESTPDSSGSPGIDSDRFMTQAASIGINSN